MVLLELFHAWHQLGDRVYYDCCYYTQRHLNIWRVGQATRPRTWYKIPVFIFKCSYRIQLLLPLLVVLSLLVLLLLLLLLL